MLRDLLASFLKSIQTTPAPQADPPPTSGRFKSPAELVDHSPLWASTVAPALALRVVEIVTPFKNVLPGIQAKGVGSGFLLDATHILTASHVIDSCPMSGLAFDGPNPGLQGATAKRAITLEKADLALIELDHPVAGDLPPVKLAPVSGSGRSQEIFGYSLQQRCWVRNHAQPTDNQHVQRFGSTDARWVHGDSGSSMLNAVGQLVAVVTQAVITKYSGSRSFPINETMSNRGASLKTLHVFLKKAWPGYQ